MDTSELIKALREATELLQKYSGHVEKQNEQITNLLSMCERYKALYEQAAA